jgi:hypothetical protein
MPRDGAIVFGNLIGVLRDQVHATLRDRVQISQSLFWYVSWVTL